MVIFAAVMVALGIAALAFAFLGPQERKIDSRRRLGLAEEESLLTQLTQRTTSLLDAAVRGPRAAKGTGLLEDAGIKTRPQDAVLMAIVAGVVFAAVGVILIGPVGLLLVVLSPVGARFYLKSKIKRRQAKFADQLDDSLQLMASSLRAGHSLAQALQSVARETEEPTSVEFARVINQNSVGRDLSESLNEVSARMDSQDFRWVTQAVEINREVGGNLADVLDAVSNTIRDRNQIRRQVKALSAEGKLSAIVLMLLPIGIVGFLSFSNPEYIHKLVESVVGYALIVASILLFAVGGWWMSKVVKIKF